MQPGDRQLRCAQEAAAVAAGHGGEAEVDQNCSLTVPVAGLLKYHQRMLVAGTSLFKPPQPSISRAEVGQSLTLAVQVADLAAVRNILKKAANGLFKTPLLPIGGAEVA